MEGGADPSIASDVQTADNTQSLRESLHRIFKENIQEEVNIVISMQHGYKNAVKRFIEKEDTANLFLYVDLDGAPNTKEVWLRKLEQDGFHLSEEQKLKCFFMIQEMEAWILYQLLAIEQWGVNNGFTRKKPEIPLEADNNLAGKKVTDIPHPSDILSILLGRYFEKEVAGKKRKAKYGKLKTAPSLLDLLDAIILARQDEELGRFVEIMNKKSKCSLYS
jgi:hypothetical protein